MFYYLLDIFWFIVFIKIFLFWLWLWQLKKYHTGSFRAYFETQKIKKIFSSFWQVRHPKFTPKIIIIFLTGAGLAIFWLFYFPNFVSGPLLIILTPFFVFFLILFFEIPIIIWRNNLIKKAKEKRNKFENLLVIGITGSFGKTSTKEYLATILSDSFNVLKTKENHNTETGVSQCILEELTPEHQVFICEMGAYNKGQIKLLCDITKPQIGILTGVNEQHLSTFGSMENLLSAEGGEELMASLPKDGMAFFNAQNSYCRKLYKKVGIKKFLYGQNILFSGQENILGAMAVAQKLGMSEKEIEQGVQKIENKFPGIEIKKGRNGLTIIDATYSANPTGVMAHLDYLTRWSGRKIIIMPCLIELGPKSQKIHQEIGVKIAEVCDLAIITTKDRFLEIKQGVSHRGVKPRGGTTGFSPAVNPAVVFMKNPKEIIAKIKGFVKDGDVLLLEGRLPQKLVEEIKSLLHTSLRSRASKR